MDDLQGMVLMINKVYILFVSIVKENGTGSFGKSYTYLNGCDLMSRR